MKIGYILIAIALLASGQTHSAIVTWSYSGTITNVEASFSDQFETGDVFSGYFSYDTASLPSSNGILPAPYTSGELAQYNDVLISGAFSAGNYLLSYENRANNVYMTNNASPSDFSDIFSTSLNIYTETAPIATSYLSVSFGSIDGSAFNSTALPDATINTSFIDTMEISITNYNSTCSIGDSADTCSNSSTTPVLGTIDSVSIRAVPLPAAIWLFGAGLMTLTLSFKRKKN